MNTQTDHSESIKKLGEMIKDIEFAMLTTAEPDGTLRSRPMATQKFEFGGDLWFFTRASSPKVDEIEQEHNVNVSYAAPDKQKYVSVSGRARLVRDKNKIKELWSPVLKAWFPKGLDDPDLALLKVAVEQAEYWDSPSSTVAQLVGFVKAVTTGTTYQPGENEKLNLKADA
ncbi:MAG: pyridoxamine 5'-phosphate oxidase family protein [Acidobacteriota bacterium]|nr:pyridoxamine 5'-phosphate oxidase family protein [Acidobacteriota bacterium]